jgi:hypothetical protein
VYQVQVERLHVCRRRPIYKKCRGTEHWLVDEGLESSAPDGFLLATRLFAPDSFSMTAGVFVPVASALLHDVIADVPQLHPTRPTLG